MSAVLHTLRELRQPLQFAFSGAVQSTNHDARVFTGEFTRRLTNIQRDITRSLPKPEQRTSAKTRLEQRQTCLSSCGVRPYETPR